MFCAIAVLVAFALSRTVGLFGFVEHGWASGIGLTPRRVSPFAAIQVFARSFSTNARVASQVGNSPAA